MILLVVIILENICLITIVEKKTWAPIVYRILNIARARFFIARVEPIAVRDKSLAYVMYGSVFHSGRFVLMAR